MSWRGVKVSPRLFSLRKSEICYRICLEVCFGGFLCCFYSYFSFSETFLTNHKLQEIGERAWHRCLKDIYSFIRNPSFNYGLVILTDCHTVTFSFVVQFAMEVLF